MRRLHYFVATSADGFIASPAGAFDAFPVQGDHIAAQLKELPETMPTAVLQALGIEARGETFDTVLMGWNTFALGKTPSPYSHLRQYVWSRKRGNTDVGPDVTLTSEWPRGLVRQLKAEASTKDIWLCGGGQLASQLVDEIDTVTLKVNPLLMGDGIKIFGSRQYAPLPLALKSTRKFASGVVWNTYELQSTS